MSSRYETIPIKKNDTGKRVRKPILYPTIPRSLDDIYLQTSPGDRLDLIAFKYYGRPSYYWIIAEANGIGKGSLNIPVGMQLRVPRNYQQIVSEYESINQ